MRFETESLYQVSFRLDFGSTIQTLSHVSAEKLSDRGRLELVCSLTQCVMVHKGST